MSSDQIKRTQDAYERGRIAFHDRNASLLDTIAFIKGDRSYFDPKYRKDRYEFHGHYGGQALSWEQAATLAGFLDAFFERSPKEFAAEQNEANDWDALTKNKERPIAIWDDEQVKAYYNAPKEDRDDWNRYAQREADELNNSGTLDSYDTTSTLYQWKPPLSFTEWRNKHRGIADRLWNRFK